MQNTASSRSVLPVVYASTTLSARTQRLPTRRSLTRPRASATNHLLPIIAFFFVLSFLYMFDLASHVDQRKTHRTLPTMQQYTRSVVTGSAKFFMSGLPPKEDDFLDLDMDMKFHHEPLFVHEPWVIIRRRDQRPAILYPRIYSDETMAITSMRQDRDYGGLTWPKDDDAQLDPSYFVREINVNDEELYNDEKWEQLDSIDGWDIFDPDEYSHYDELSYPSQDGCHEPKWYYNVYPTCNTIHETSIDRALIGITSYEESPSGLEQSFEMEYMSYGTFRDSWAFYDAQQEVSYNDYALKTLRYNPRRDFDAQAYEQVRVEAMVMERATSSDKIMSIYGHCGTSILVELGSPIEEAIIDDWNFFPDKRPDLVLSPDGKDSVVKPMNNFTVDEKLALAIAMAESLAILHGDKDGIIVNDDIQPDQWLIDSQGKIKLNDFNKALVRPWNIEKEEYCTFTSSYNYLFHSPEELQGNPTDESSDVYGFGHLLYTILTGMIPLFDKPGLEDAIRAVRTSGETPFIDNQYRLGRTDTEASLVKIMEDCWKMNRQDRIDIFEVVRRLQSAADQYETQHPGLTPIDKITFESYAGK